MSDPLHATESEKVILGTLLGYGAEMMEPCMRLQSDMFSTANNRLLFSIMEAFSAAGENWDTLAVAQKVTDRRVELAFDMSNVVYCLALTEGVYRHSHAGAHVERVISAWKRRKGAELCERAGNSLADSLDAVKTLSALQSEVFDLLAETQVHEDPHVMAFTIPEWEAFQAQAERPELSMGMPYGSQKLDELTYGMHPGEMTVLGARSGVGKTLMMCQAARSVCLQGHSADLFSLEMSREKILRRLWVMESGVQAHKIRHPHLANLSDRRAVQEAAFRVAEWPLRVYDRADMHISEICARARQGIRQHNSRFIGVDYAQIVNAEGKLPIERVSNVSQALRKLAKSDGAHVMLLSQLRKADSRSPNHPPSDEDLRETGQLKNDANVIVLLHRSVDDAGKITNEAQILVPKCREGATGTLESAFSSHSLMFS